MDLSKYSDDDYGKVKRGDISGLSDAGYLMYKQQTQQYQQSQKQSQNPQTVPDDAYKAAHPKDQVVNPQTAAADDAIKMARVNPNSASAVAMRAADKATSPDEANSLAGGLIPGGPVASKIAGYLGKAGKGVAGAVGDTMGSGLANDALGMVSPRLAKLASFLGKVAPKAEEKVAEQAPKRWYPPLQKRE